MDKAVISDKIYISNPTSIELDSIISSLTYKIPKAFNPNLSLSQFRRFTPFEIIKNYKIISDNIIAIPQTRTDLLSEDVDIIDKRINLPIEYPKPLYPLYDNQLEVYNKVDGNCIINAEPGWGKTFTALHVAHKLGQKALIIVHTLFLRDQWQQSINNLFGVDCGLISSGHYDTTKFITVANIQSLRKHISKLSKLFGLVIVDEAHHISAPIFTETLVTFHSLYKIGLSGTLQRKDGKHILFKDSFGDNVIKSKGNTMTPSVKLIRTKFKTEDGLGWADRLTSLLGNAEYKQYIANLAIAHVQMGHCVLVLGDRTDFVDSLKDMIGEECVAVTGKTKDREDIVDSIMRGDYNCVSASTRIFSEGISVNRLSAVILANPINNDSLLEQIIGRIQRFHDGKLNPLIVDIQLSGYADAKQNNSRRGLYMRKGWHTEELEI